MSQLNIHITPAFEKALSQFMRIRHIKTKSEAIRIAIQECLSKMKSQSQQNYANWIGLAKKAPLNKKPRFKSDHDLWK